MKQDLLPASAVLGFVATNATGRSNAVMVFGKHTPIAETAIASPARSAAFGSGAAGRGVIYKLRGPLTIAAPATGELMAMVEGFDVGAAAAFADRVSVEAHGRLTTDSSNDAGPKTSATSFMTLTSLFDWPSSGGTHYCDARSQRTTEYRQRV